MSKRRVTSPALSSGSDSAHSLAGTRDSDLDVPIEEASLLGMAEPRYHEAPLTELDTIPGYQAYVQRLLDDPFPLQLASNSNFALN
jgi:hypothetical protein